MVINTEGKNQKSAMPWKVTGVQSVISCSGVVFLLLDIKKRERSFEEMLQ